MADIDTQALVDYNIVSPGKYTIYALTRNSATASATRLASLPGVKVMQVPKDVMSRPAAAFAALGWTKGDLYGVYSVQGYVDAETDAKQGVSSLEAQDDRQQRASSQRGCSWDYY
jgi:hypothetical protein